MGAVKPTYMAVVWQWCGSSVALIGGGKGRGSANPAARHSVCQNILSKSW